MYNLRVKQKTHRAIFKSPRKTRTPCDGARCVVCCPACPLWIHESRQQIILGRELTLEARSHSFGFSSSLLTVRSGTCIFDRLSSYKAVEWSEIRNAGAHKCRPDLPVSSTPSRWVTRNSRSWRGTRMWSQSDRGLKALFGKFFLSSLFSVCQTYVLWHLVLPMIL